MNIFKKAIKEAEKLDKDIEVTYGSSTLPEEEWIWVEGYKGTDKNMRCRDFQYELGKQFDVDKEKEVNACHNGFHLCLDLNDVFEYYPIGKSNRFFKVKALVHKADKEDYGKYFMWNKNDKLAAKSIIFTEELPIDKIFEPIWPVEIPNRYRVFALETDLNTALSQYNIDTLVDDGYSLAFAKHLENEGLFETAHAVGSQKDLSMDMKVLYILNG
jgi:hypothetical protein